MSEYLDRFFDAPEYEGVDLDVLPRGRYPVKLVGVSSNVSAQKTSVNANFRFEVLEGPHKGRRISVRKSLANVFDPDVNETYLASSSTLTRYLGCAFKKDVAQKVDMFESAAHAAEAFYNLESGVGNKLIIDIGVETSEQITAAAVARGAALMGVPSDRNTLLAWHKWDDPDHGFENWKAKHLPKQLEELGKAKSTAKADSNTGPVVL